MAPNGERKRTNAWGPFYVTDECDGCGICADCAPDNFAQSWDGTYYTVVQQPETEDMVRETR
jgi:ferredoxin